MNVLAIQPQELEGYSWLDGPGRKLVNFHVTPKRIEAFSIERNCTLLLNFQFLDITFTLPKLRPSANS